MKQIKITIPDERPKSMNLYWAGMSHRTRTSEKNRVKLLVREQVDPNEAELFESPVDILFEVYFHGKMQDSDNLVAKPYIDALIGWYIEDDNPKFVRYVKKGSFKDNQAPRVEITLTAI